MNKNISKLLSALTSIGLVILIFIQVDIDQCSKIFIQTKVQYIYIVGFVLSPVLLILLVFRWKLILQDLDVNFSFFALFNSYTKGLLWGELTPGKIGEVLRVRYIYKYKKKNMIGLALLSIFIDRICDLLVLFIITIVSCIYFINNFNINYMFSVLMVAIVSVLSVFLSFCFRNKIGNGLKKIINVFLWKYRERFNIQYDNIIEGINKLNAKNIFIYIFITFTIWIVKVVSLPLFTLSLNIEIPLLYLFAVGIISVTISLLPISIAGIGTREIIFIYFLSYYKISPEASVLVSIMFYLFGIWSIALAIIMNVAYSQFKKLQSYKRFII
ncbi:lysylphosphatidylglycerol synthase transmembrane domain-containing protein [uncultured Desulfobacter sp.]|uniref:lysylphosphatidylglycerol synthase transmembrane domain-containing protein n=1 Tax=uncultured Desulfobacter sp. TaxID=240139 RepID=UPI0029F56149|nr:lysylphosphatidylglycerol synthase transmembrane domain-containing protein [uncultured Desulfobacter sp.]